MRLVRVPPNKWSNCRFTCAECGGVTYDNSDPVYADLDGEPFRTYYCDVCAARVILREERSTS